VSGALNFFDWVKQEEGRRQHAAGCEPQTNVCEKGFEASESRVHSSTRGAWCCCHGSARRVTFRLVPQHLAAARDCSWSIECVRRKFASVVAEDFGVCGVEFGTQTPPTLFPRCVVFTSHSCGAERSVSKSKASSQCSGWITRTGSKVSTHENSNVLLSLLSNQPRLVDILRA
jgi:hypothetical protein